MYASMSFMGRTFVEARRSADDCRSRDGALRFVLYIYMSVYLCRYVRASLCLWFVFELTEKYKVNTVVATTKTCISLASGNAEIAHLFAWDYGWLSHAYALSVVILVVHICMYLCTFHQRNCIYIIYVCERILTLPTWDACYLQLGVLICCCSLGMCGWYHMRWIK